MPTIYHWTDPHTVSQQRYDQLLTRAGWFSVPTPPVMLDKDTEVASMAQGFRVPEGWGQYWYPAMREAMRGNGKAQVAWMGSSTMQGYYASDLDATSAFAIVRDTVQRVAGDGGSGYQGMQFSDTFLAGAPAGAYARYQAMGNAWVQTLNAGAISTPTFDIGPSGRLNISGGATVDIPFRGTRLALWFFNNHSASPFTYAVDGGSAVTVTPGAGMGSDLAMIRLLSPTVYSAGEHSVRITGGTNAIYFVGIDAENDTGVVFNQYAIAGAQSDRYSNVDSYESGTYMGGHRFRNTYGVAATEETPDLLIIGVPPNDAIKASESFSMTTNGTTTVTSTSWRRYHVGRTVSGTGIAAGTTVLSVSEASSAVLSAAASDSTTGSRTVTNPTAVDRFVKNWEQYLAGVLDNVYGGGTAVEGKTDVVIVNPMMKISSDTVRPTWRRIQIAAESLATVYGAAFIDIGGILNQSWSRFYNLGYMGNGTDPVLYDGSNPASKGNDDVHLSDAGHAFMAEQILKVVMR